MILFSKLSLNISLSLLIIPFTGYFDEERNKKYKMQLNTDMMRKSAIMNGITVVSVGLTCLLMLYEFYNFFNSQRVPSFKYNKRTTSKPKFMAKFEFDPSTFVPEDNSKELSFLCKETFNKTLEENLEVIKNYPRGDTEKYLLKIGVNKTSPDKMRSFPVFATAFDSTYYFGVQGLIKTIHEKFLASQKYGKEVLIIVYDLGMTSLHYNKVKRNCKCELRRFPFEKFPRHVMRLKLYAFKPIIVQQLLMEFGFVWWMDTSHRFITDSIDPALDYAKKYSMYFSTARGRFVNSVTKHTDIAMFEYLHEDRCKFRPFGEFQADMVLFHYDHITRIAVEVWAACALNKDCIAPHGFNRHCDFSKDYDGRCHRFDQSVLGIITRRLFHEQNRYPLDRRLDGIYQTKRRGNVPYFV